MWIVEFSSECSSTSLGAAFNNNLNQLNAYRNRQQILTTGLQKKCIALNQLTNVLIMLVILEFGDSRMQCRDVGVSKHSVTQYFVGGAGKTHIRPQGSFQDQTIYPEFKSQMLIACLCRCLCCTLHWHTTLP